MNLSKNYLTKVALAASLSLFAVACDDSSTPTAVVPTPAPTVAPTAAPTAAPTTAPTPAAADLRLTAPAAAGDSQIAVTATGNLEVGQFLRFGGNGAPQVIITGIAAPNTVRFSPPLPAGFTTFGVGSAPTVITPPAVTLTAAASSGATTVTVTSSTGVVVGSLIRFGTFIPNALGGGTFSQTGNPVRVTAVTGNVITFTPGLSASLPAGAQGISTLQVSENSNGVTNQVRVDDPAGLAAYAPQGPAVLSNFFTLGSGSTLRGVLGIAGNLVTHNIPTTIAAGDTLVPATTLPSLYTTLPNNANTITFQTAGNAQTVTVNSVAAGGVVARAFVDFQNVGGTSPGGGTPAVGAGLTRVRVTNVNSDRNFQALAPVGSPAIPQLGVGTVVAPQPVFATGANALNFPVLSVPNAAGTTTTYVAGAGATLPLVGEIITLNATVTAGNVPQIGAPLTVTAVAPATGTVTFTPALAVATAATDTFRTLQSFRAFTFATPTDASFFLAGDPVTFTTGATTVSGTIASINYTLGQVVLTAPVSTLINPGTTTVQLPR